MSYQIITKMIYNAHTHQIETWQHSNNVWPRIDHFLALDVRTDEQLFRFISLVAEGTWQTRKWSKAFETLFREYPELRMDSYRDNFNADYALIPKCLNEKSPESLWENIDGWYNDSAWDTAKGIMEKLKEKCFLFHDFDEEEVESFFEEHDDEIRSEIYARDDSDVLTELIKHTDDIPVRVEMLSDYDCINSNWFESQGGYRYEESYFGDMVDVLNLNPARVKKMLVEKGYTAHGRFPDRKSRYGKEQVPYGHFYQELVNLCTGICTVIFWGDWCLLSDKGVFGEAERFYAELSDIYRSLW